MSDKKLRIIHIMNHPPAYEECGDNPRPAVNWDTPDGSWVGMWGYEWGDQIGSAIVKHDKSIIYEVWQPDLRADKRYEYIFKNNLKHVLFPAIIKKRVYGLKIINVVFSDMMINDLNSIKNSENTIIHLGDLHISLKYIIPKLLNNFIYVNQFMGEINYPFNGFFVLKQNLPGIFFHYFDYAYVCKNLYKFSAIIVANNKRVNLLEKKYKGKIQKLVNGIDCDFWAQECNVITKESYGFKKDDFIILMASRFTPNKQIDKFIKVLNAIEERNDFNYKCLIIGHGKPSYEEHLKKLANKLISRNKIKFYSYQNREELRNFYVIADLFVSVSNSEGGPTTVKQAMVCGIPVFMTSTGHTAEVLTTYEAGCIVEVNDYKQWEHKIQMILDGSKINILPVELAKEYYSWDNLAVKYIELYKSVI